MQGNHGREWSAEQAIVIGAAAEATLVALGVRLPPENRLALSRRHLAEYKSSLADPRDFGFRSLIAAQQNVIEAFLIARTFQAMGRQEAAARLQHLLKGQLDIRQDLSSSARDLQFELLVLALCDLAGLRGRLAEPDIVVSDPRREIGIAAKRIASAGALRKRVKDAIRQIKDSTGYGILALNVDQITASETGSQASETVARMSAAAYAELEHLDALQSVAGVLTIGSVIHRRGDGIPTLSYDFGICMVSMGPEHDLAYAASWDALANRARRISDALFDEALADGT